MLNIGLVIEGRHDNVMLSPLILAELERLGIREVRITNIHPRADETGSIPDGGWKKTRAWLKENAGENLNTFFVPLFASAPAYDAIIIHLDGDALQHVCNGSSVECPSLPTTVKNRVECIAKAIEEWTDFGPHRNKAIFAIPVNSTEAWILASEATHHDIETMDAKEEFRRPFSREKHGNLHRFYALRADSAKDKLEEIAAQCVSYVLFRTQLAALAD